MLEKTAQLSSLPKSPGGFVYQRHKTEETDLYKIIEQTLPSFQSHLSNADISLPAFVHDEFRNYLRFEMLKHGFLRVMCNGCRFEHIVAFRANFVDFVHPACPLCGGTMRVIADITDPDVIQKILDHIEAQPPPLKPATAIQS